MPSLPEIALNLGIAIAVVWIGGALVISGADRLLEHLRRHRPALPSREPSHWNPGPAQDL